jgi:Papain family cysteine protease
MPTTRYYGWKRDRPDDRDRFLIDHVELPEAVPAAVDLRTTGNLADPVFDQGQLGSCTANAIAAALMYVQRATRLPEFVPSRLALYYAERVIEGTPDQDSGAELRDGLKVVAGQPGYVAEAEWPYDVARFAVAPPAAVVADEAKDRATKYMRVDVDLHQMKAALAAGFPVVIGFDVFQGIESDQAAQTGEVPMPGPGEQPIGGHAVLLVGYDDARQRWTFRNSWGPGWGDAGYGYLPYGYVDDPSYATDFWVIQQEVEGSVPAPAPTPAPPAPTPSPDPAPPPSPSPSHAAVVAWLEQEAERLPEPVRDWIEHELRRLQSTSATETTGGATTTIGPLTTGTPTETRS